MIYIIVILTLLVAMLIYFRIAEQYKIIDTPNNRSSHKTPTIRGGGIVYWLAVLLYAIYNYRDPSIWLFCSGITIVAGVSFADDIHSLSPYTRLSIQALGAIIIGIYAHIYNIYASWSVLILLAIIGIVNIYNFMDGINGMHGLYSLVVFGELQYINLKVVPFVDADIIWFAIAASAIFLIFNFRTHAKCFAGDIGSVSTALWIATLLLLLIEKTSRYEYILFLSVYGADAVLTIIHRLILKQNITQAHRLHLYQVMSNECKMPQLLVASIYAAMQALIGAVVILLPEHAMMTTIITIIGLTGIYMIKFRLMKQRT